MSSRSELGSPHIFEPAASPLGIGLTIASLMIMAALWRWRLALADRLGSPALHGVSADAAAIEVGGRSFGKTKKYRDIRANTKAAIAIDDLASVTPWTPRGVEVRGTAVLQDGGGGTMPSGEPWARITPERIVSWGLETSR